MRNRLISFSVIAAVVLGILSLVSFSNAQTKAAAPKAVDPSTKPTPRTPDGHPDFSGFWLDGTVNYLTTLPDGSKLYAHTADPEKSAPRLKIADNPEVEYTWLPPYKPEALETVKHLGAFSIDNINPSDPNLACIPMGIPRATLHAHTGGLQIIQNKDYVGLLYESAPGPYFRIIYIDGRKHPANLDTSYFGHAIGHWEGDTLVTDVIGFNDETSMAGSPNGGPYAGWLLPHSEKEHVVERFTRKGNLLTYEATVDDPEMFSKPWPIKPDHIILAEPGEYLNPQMCIVHDAKYVASQLEKLGIGKIDYDRLGDIHYTPEGVLKHQETYMGGKDAGPQK